MYLYVRTMPLANLWQDDKWLANIAKGQVGTVTKRGGGRGRGDKWLANIAKGKVSTLRGRGGEGGRRRDKWLVNMLSTRLIPASLTPYPSPG